MRLVTLTIALSMLILASCGTPVAATDASGNLEATECASECTDASDCAKKADCAMSEEECAAAKAECSDAEKAECAAKCDAAEAGTN